MDSCNRRELAHRLQQQDALLERCRTIKKNIDKQPSKVSLASINEIAVAADTIIDKTKTKEHAENSTGVVLDSVLLKCNYQLISKVIQKTLSFNETTYINNLNRIRSSQNLDWDSVSELACHAGYSLFLTRTVTLNHEESEICTQKKERPARRTRKLETELQPETLSELQRDEEGMEEIRESFQQIQSLFDDNNLAIIPYYQLIVDPNNFMNTVINALHLSFLLSEGTIIIEEGSDSFPAVRLAKNSDCETSGAVSQAAITLDVALCQEMVQYYNIKAPLLRRHSKILSTTCA